MKSKMRDEMKYAWIGMHGKIMDNTINAYDAGFEEGFEACHNLLMPLLEMSAAHVFASARTAHLTDGFRPHSHPIDELVERIKAVIPDA